MMLLQSRFEKLVSTTEPRMLVKANRKVDEGVFKLEGQSDRLETEEMPLWRRTLIHCELIALTASASFLAVTQLALDRVYC